MNKANRQIKKFNKEQSKEHSSGMKPYDAVSWIAKCGKIADVKLNDSQVRGIAENADRQWRSIETGIKDDLKKQILLRQKIVISMVENCIRAKYPKRLSKLLQLTAAQVILLSRLESRWKTKTSIYNVTYDGKEHLDMIIE